MTAEDGLDDTIKPRFDSMGGDATRLYALTGSSLTDEAGKDHEFAVSLADIDVLREMLEQVNPSLVVIDPIQAYLGADVDMHRANEVRPLLSGLSKLAEEFQCAFLLLRHLTKGQKSKAMYAGMGSIDFAAAARSVLMAGEHNGSKIMAHVKSSLAPTGKSMSYSIGGDDGFTWGGISALTAEDLRAFTPETESKDTSGSLEEATEWLESQLVEGALPAKALVSYASKEGISKITLERAKKELGVRSRRQSKGNEGAGTWLWYLEEHEELATSSTEDVVDSSLRTHVDNLANVAENSNRDTTPATLSNGSDDNVAKLLTLPCKNDDFARLSNTTLRGHSVKNSFDDVAGVLSWSAKRS